MRNLAAKCCDLAAKSLRKCAKKSAKNAVFCLFLLQKQKILIKQGISRDLAF